VRGALLSLILAAPLAASPSSLRVTFIGNAAFAITDGRSTLYTDFPYRSGAFGYMTYDRASVPDVADSICLVTHGHADHFDPDLFRTRKSLLIAPASAAAGVPRSRVLPFAPKMSWRGIEVEAFPTPHGSIEHDSYLVTWRGLRLYLTGDTDSPDRLLAMRDLDVAFVTPWLLAAIEKQGARIDARQIVVCHHRPGERVTTWQRPRVPSQGETFVVERPPTD